MYLFLSSFVLRPILLSLLSCSFPLCDEQSFAASLPSRGIEVSVVFRPENCVRLFFFSSPENKPCLATRRWQQIHHTKVPGEFAVKEKKMLTARSLQRVFAPRCRFLPHSGSDCSASFATLACWLPRIRSRHDGGAGGDALSHSFAPAAEAVSVRTGVAAAGHDEAANAAAKRRREDSLAKLRPIISAKEFVDDAAAEVAHARVETKDAQNAVRYAKLGVIRAAKGVDGARAAAALEPGDAKLAAAVSEHEAELAKHKAELEHMEAWLRREEAKLKDWCERRLMHAETYLKNARAAAAAERSFNFPRVAPDVALRQLGALVRLRRFEVPTWAQEEAERHVCTLRDVFGRSVDKSEVPNLVAAATPGAGKTTLLRYLQQIADTVRYGADLRSDTNWLARGWSAPRADVKSAPQSMPALRQVFVGFATFKGADVNFDPSIDTEAAIERRCAWRILYDAGLAPEWTPNFDFDFHQAAKMLRAKISAAKGCESNEIAIVFLIDEVKSILEGPRYVLRDALAAWQKQELANTQLSFSIVAVSRSVVTDAALFWYDRRDDEWFWCRSLLTVKLPVPSLEEIPRELEAEIMKDAHLDSHSKSHLVWSIGVAQGHPRTVKDIAHALADFQEEER
jgi:hypothetical protein